MAIGPREAVGGNGREPRRPGGSGSVQLQFIATDEGGTGVQGEQMHAQEERPGA